MLRATALVRVEQDRLGRSTIPGLMRPLLERLGHARPESRPFLVLEEFCGATSAKDPDLVEDHQNSRRFSRSVS